METKICCSEPSNALHKKYSPPSYVWIIWPRKVHCFCECSWSSPISSCPNSSCCFAFRYSYCCRICHNFFPHRYPIFCQSSFSWWSSTCHQQGPEDSCHPEIPCVAVLSVDNGLQLASASTSLATSAILPLVAVLDPLPSLPIIPAYVSDTETMDEEIEIVSELSSPIPRPTIPPSLLPLPRHASSDPLPQTYTHHEDIDDGSWITKKKCKPSQKTWFWTVPHGNSL